jgi:hypothetical protein
MYGLQSIDIPEMDFRVAAFLSRRDQCSRGYRQTADLALVFDVVFLLIQFLV